VSRGKELLCNRKAFTRSWDSPNPVELAFRHLTFPGGTKKGIKGDVAQYRRRQAGFFTNLLTAIVQSTTNLLVLWFECQPPDVLLTNQVG